MACTLKWLPPTGWGAKPPYFLGFLPSNLGWDFFRYAIMPSIALGLGTSAIIARLTRASLLQIVREDYIRTARAKGLPERMVITRHALKNSLIPVVTILGPLFAALVTGTFVTELIFGIPGMGKYFVTSITNRDYPVIMGTILLYAVFSGDRQPGRRPDLRLPGPAHPLRLAGTEARMTMAQTRSFLTGWRRRACR